MRPKRSTAALAAATACASSVTSRRTLNRLSWSPSTLVTAREVATTKSPRLSAARASSRPRPLEAPVMNQTLWMRSAARLGAFMTAPRRCERLTLYQPVVHGCLAWRRRHVARTAPAATQRRWRFPRSARVPPGRSAHRGECRAGLSARPPEEPETGRRAGYRRLRPSGRRRMTAGKPSWQFSLGCRLLVARSRRDHVRGKHRRRCVVHHGVHVLDTDAVRAVVGLHDVHDGVVRVLLRPVALELEHDLQRRDRLRARLDHPLHRVVVRELTDVAAAVLHDVHLVAVVYRLNGRKGDTHFGPESREHDLLPTGCLDRGHEVLVVPSVHG